MQGDHGLKASAQRKALLHQAIQDRNAADIEHQAWEKRVAGLRAKHLDPDTLNERARAMLYVAEPTDIIVKLGPKDKLF
jgi:cell division protein FtsB